MGIFNFGPSVQEQINNLRPELDQLWETLRVTYDFQKCSKCGEGNITFLSISPTGQSIHYRCDFCKKKLFGKILPGKDGNLAANQFHSLTAKYAVITKGKFSVVITCTLESNPNNQQQVGQKRTPIPESVRSEVWRRDHGKCVECGSQMKLEFDHIIPFSKGGSNTARNLQLLCENCNRKKHDKI
jgi:hypothetical protein